MRKVFAVAAGIFKLASYIISYHVAGWQGVVLVICIYLAEAYSRAARNAI